MEKYGDISSMIGWPFISREIMVSFFKCSLKNLTESNYLFKISWTKLH